MISIYFDGLSHGLGDSGSEVGGSRQGGRVLARSFASDDGDRRWISGTVRIAGSKPNGSLESGGFGGGRTPLGPDPRIQFPFAASRHFAM